MMGESEPGPAPAENQYAGMTREQLTEILSRAGGKQKNVSNPEAFRQAWKATKAPAPLQRDDDEQNLKRELEDFEKKHPDYFPKDTPLEKKLGELRKIQAKHDQDRADKRESFQKLDWAVERKQKEKPGKTPQPEQSPDEREIITTNQRLRECTGQALTALLEKNNPPRIFIRSGGLVRIKTDEKLIPSIQICDPDILKSILERSACFYKLRGDASKKVISPPSEIVKDVLVNTDWSGFPVLEGIIESPAIMPDGAITDSAGYYPDLKMMYIPAPDLQLTAIAKKPGPADITEAVKILNEPFIDFPFCDEASKANTLAALLTAVLRPVISGFVPLALIDKPQPGIGASLMTDVISVIATGRPPAKMTAPTTEEEWRKTITARLSQGQGLIIIDNVDKKLDSGSLASVLTSETWNDRVLGKSETTALTNHAVFIANGINVQTSSEIARRVYYIRIDAHQARPDQRINFLHPDLIEWVKPERGRILAAVLTLTRSWIQAGCPPPTGIPQMGSFEKWRGMIGGILSNAGIPGFLGNLEQFRERSDIITGQWDSFLHTLKENFPGSFTANDVVARLDTSSNDRQRSFDDPSVQLSAVVPDDLHWKDKDPGKVIGNAFRKRADFVFPTGIVLRKEEKQIHKITAWRVEDANQNDGEIVPVENASFGNRERMDQKFWDDLKKR